MDEQDIEIKLLEEEELLKAKIVELEGRLARNGNNSSRLPSSNELKRQKREKRTSSLRERKAEQWRTKRTQRFTYIPAIPAKGKE